MENNIRNSNKKVKVGIIGTGNIGTDLLIKIGRSPYLECSIFAGRNPDSEGIRFAQKLNVPVTYDSIHYIQEHPDCCDIVFDATSAAVHKYHAPILKELGKYVIDLTPAHIGIFTIPVINIEEAVSEDNVNMVTCGGQAIVPIAYALTRVHPDTKYLELVATIASKSAGPGTRANIDEFTQSTSDAIAFFTGIKNTKAIINLNPAKPEMTIRNTLYALIDNPNMEEITKKVNEMEKAVQEYVPGYKVVVPPVYDNGRVVVTVEVQGCGDYLPCYAGNLDIITCAAIRVAEKYAEKRGNLCEE